MLGKLFKYDMKDTLKSMLPIYAIWLIFSLMLKILNIIASEVSFLKYVASFTTLIWVITIVVGLIYCFFITIRNFYQKVLKDEGYLTNTLPIGKGSIITSKLLAGLISMIISVILVFVSLLIVYYSKDLFAHIGTFIQNILPGADYNVVTALMIVGVLIPLAYLVVVSVINCGLVIGHSFSNRKFTYSVVAGIVLYFVYQLINIIGFGIIFLINKGLFENMSQSILPFSAFIQIFMVSIIGAIIMNVVSYILTYTNLKNKLNLE